LDRLRVRINIILLKENVACCVQRDGVFYYYYDDDILYDPDMPLPKHTAARTSRNKQQTKVKQVK